MTHPSVYHRLPTIAAFSLILLSAPVFSGEAKNAKAVASCASGSDLGGVLSEIKHLTPNKQKRALNQLDPSLYKGFAVTQEQNTTNFRKAISRRLDERTFGTCAAPCDEKWDIWADVYGDIAKQRERPAQVGYKAKTGTGVIGADYLAIDPLVVGLATGYSYSHLNWNEDQGDGHVQAAYGSLYAGVASKYIYSNAAITGGWINEKGTRNISFPGVHSSATHTNDGGEGAAHIDLGFNKNVRNFFWVHPFGSGDYIYIHENGYTEHGANSLDLRVKSTNSQLVRGETGLKLSRCFDLDESSLAFDVRASWIREMRISGRNNKSSFKDTDCTFTTTGYFLNRSLLGVGADIMGFFFDDKMSVAVGYDAEFGAHYSDQLFDLHLGWRI